jgi:hypothetical protein
MMYGGRAGETYYYHSHGDLISVSIVLGMSSNGPYVIIISTSIDELSLTTDYFYLAQQPKTNISKTACRILASANIFPVMVNFPALGCGS